MVFTLVYVRIDLSHFQLQFNFSYQSDLRVQLDLCRQFQMHCYGSLDSVGHLHLTCVLGYIQHPWADSSFEANQWRACRWGLFWVSFGLDSGEVVTQYPGRSSGTKQMIVVPRRL